jgi:hypothetical protein
MKKIFTIFLVCFLFTLGACSSNTNSKQEDAPEYIKESFEYFSAMSKVIDAVSDGENIEVARKKHFAMEDDAISFIEKNEGTSDASEEEQLVVMNIKLMHTMLFNMSIQAMNASWGGDPVDFEQDIYDLQVPRFELEEIYNEYDLEYNN